jgi:hypothetical protein
MTVPVLSSSDPIDNSTNIYLNKKIDITFNTALAASSISGSTVILRSVALDSVVDAEISVLGTKITIVPYTLLLANSIYRVTLIGSDLALSTGAIKSSDTSSSLVATEVLSFQTGSQLDTSSVTRTEEEITLGGDLNLPGDISLTSTKLTLASSVPTNHAFGVATDTNTIQLTFSAALNASTVNSTNVQVLQYAFLDEEHLLATGGVFYTNDTGGTYTDLGIDSILSSDKTITITPDAGRDWFNNMTVEVHLAAAVSDTGGNTLGSAQKITFHTEPYPNIVGVRGVRNELGTMIPNTYLDDYIGLRIWVNTIDQYENLGSRMNITKFSKNRSFREYLRCKTALDIIHDIRAEKDLGAGVSKQLGDFRISFFPAGAETVTRKEKMLTKRIETAMDSLIGYMNKPVISTIDKGSVVIRGSRQIRGPFAFNSQRNVYVSDPIPAANTARERDRLIPGISDME